MSDILVITMISPRTGQAASAVAALGDLATWESGQPGLVWIDVLADPQKADVFWIAERWASRALRDAARVDPAGAARLATLEALLAKDDVAAYVPVDRYPHYAGNAVPAKWVWSDRAAPLTTAIAKDAPMVQIARFHLKPGNYDRFIAVEGRHEDTVNDSGVIALEIARHSDNPNRLCHYELWESAERHQGYADSYERQRFIADAGDLLVEPEPAETLSLLARYVPPDAAEPVGHGVLIPPVDHKKLSAEAARAMAQVPPVAFFDTIGHAQRALKPQMDLMLALMAKDIALEQRHRMLAVLLTLVTNGVAYEWNRQLEPARANGVTQDEIDAIVVGWRGSPLFTGKDRLVLRATAEMLALGRATPATMTRLVKQLGPGPTVELLLNVGHFRSMGQIILSARLLAEASPDRADDSRGASVT